MTRLHRLRARTTGNLGQFSQNAERSCYELTSLLALAYSPSLSVDWPTEVSLYVYRAASSCPEAGPP